jgi:hypothetical protein
MAKSEEQGLRHEQLEFDDDDSTTSMTSSDDDDGKKKKKKKDTLTTAVGPLAIVPYHHRRPIKRGRNSKVQKRKRGKRGGLRVKKTKKRRTLSKGDDDDGDDDDDDNDDDDEDDDDDEYDETDHSDNNDNKSTGGSRQSSGGNNNEPDIDRSQHNLWDTNEDLENDDDRGGDDQIDLDNADDNHRKRRKTTASLDIEETNSHLLHTPTHESYRTRNLPVTLACFDFSTMRKDSNIYLVGKRNSGKNVYLAHWLTRLCSPMYASVPTPTSPHRGWIGKIAVISKSEKYNHFYRDVIGVPEAFISYDYSADFILRLMRVQQYLSEHLSPSSKKNFKHWLAIILDDVSFDKNVKLDQSLLEFMFYGRHMMTVVIQLAQDPLMASRGTRNCYDYVICTRENTRQCQKRLHENYYGMFKFDQFVSTMIRYTNNFKVLIADNTRNFGGVSKQYFWDRALSSDYWKKDPSVNDGKCVREMIKLDYSDLIPFKRFMKRRTDPGAALGKTAGQRFDLLDEELRNDLVNFYKDEDLKRTHPRLANPLYD